MATGTADQTSQPISASPMQRLGAGLLMHLTDQIVDNPIFLRELRRRMRGRALFVAMISYIAIMAGVAFVIVFARVVHMRWDDAVNIMPLMAEMSDDLFFERAATNEEFRRIYYTGTPSADLLLLAMVGIVFTGMARTARRRRTGRRATG